MTNRQKKQKKSFLTSIYIEIKESFSIPKKFRLEIISGYLLAVICFIVGILSYQDSNATLESANKFTGIITETKIVNAPSSIAGRFNVYSEVFTFKLQGLEQTFAIYNPKQNYSFYEENLKIGDNIKVFYKRNRQNKLNLDAYQIEKDGKLISNIQKHARTNRMVSYWAFLCGIVLVGLNVYMLKRRKRGK